LELRQQRQHMQSSAGNKKMPSTETHAHAETFL